VVQSWSYLIECAFPYEEDVMQSSNWVFSFPVKSPESSLVREDLSAIDQLELYKTYKENWCEHNPSITVYVRENEWFKVGSWVYDNFDSLGGVSFLPYSDHIYRQAPYQPVSEQEYELDILSSPKNVNWDNFLEEEDNVESYKELACMGGICEI
jgi:ribonucleoside-diphosphate reductase alpha chain